MVRHFFLDKTNTIVENSMQNMGLNPVMHIGYGNLIMRGLLHFDECKIRELIEDKTFANIDKLKFTLRMTNYFSIEGIPYEKKLIQSMNVPTKRAASFDLILFKLPNDFDEGRGFDFVSDFWVRNNKSFSKDGSNWFFCRNSLPWNYEREEDKPAKELVMPDIFDKVEFIHIYKKLLKYSKIMNEEELEEESNVTCEEIIDDIKNIKTNIKLDEKSLKGGIYLFETIKEEYQKYLDGEESIVIASQHFDFGDENLAMDITDYVLSIVNGEHNNGLCLAFAPKYEEMTTDFEEYVGFVDDNTNTFFHPYVEAVYSDYILDGRESFTLGRENSLYLYTYDDGQPINLDEIPSCSVEGMDVPVRQVSKGVYEARIDASELDLEPAAIYYDKWSNLAINGVSEDDVELEFSTRPKSHKLKIGSDSSVKDNVIPSVYGINDWENLHQGEVREVVADFVKEYESDKKYLIDSAEYRLYTKDGNREITIIGYQPVERAFLNNFFMIYTEDLIPNAYYVDLKVNIGRETKYYKECLRFKVVSDVTERYH